MMSQGPIEDSAHHGHAQERLQSFLDCVAYLLARRWLRESRKNDEKHPQEDQARGHESA